MSLVAKIKTLIATAYPDATLIFSSKFNANLQSFSVSEDLMPLVIINNELPIDGEFKKNNSIDLSRKVIISFLDIDKVTGTDEDTLLIQEAMEAMAIKVGSLIYQLPETVPIGGNQKLKITPMFKVFNTVLSGVALEMNANEKTVSNICPI